MKDEEWNAPYSANIPEIATVGLLLGSITAGPNEPFAHPKAHFESLQDYVESLRKLD
jgi:hypothetical protein